MATQRKRVWVQETRVAADLGGRRQPGSGSQWHSKGDVSTPTYLVECKQTDKGSYGLKLDTLRKIEREAAAAGKEPLFQVEFHGTGRIDQYVVISYGTFLSLTEKD